MAKPIRTQADQAGHWLKQAERYRKTAATCKEADRAYWTGLAEAAERRAAK